MKTVTLPKRGHRDPDVLRLVEETDGPLPNALNLTHAQRDYLITEVVLKADFESRWRIVVELFRTVADAGPLSVVTRGWHTEEDYRTLAARILAVPAIDLLVDPLPAQAAGYPNTPGELTPEADAKLWAEVARRVPGITLDNWDAATEARRLGWLRAALESRFDAAK